MKASKFFSSLTQGVSKFTSEAAKVKDKILEGQTQAEQISFSSLWEAPESVEFCRECASKLSVIKHHCRSCAGVFCDECCPSSIPTPFENSLLPPSLNVSQGDSVRICLGCRRGECPSRDIKERVRLLLDEDAVSVDKSAAGRIEKLHARIGAKLEEAVSQFNDATSSGRAMRRGSALDPQLTVLASLPLRRGSYYGENNMMKKSGSRPLAVSGYFEIFNKSSEIVALKVLKRNNCDPRFEVPRPSYVAVPPNEAVYSFFDPERDILEILVLYKNINSVPSDSAVLFDTKAPGSQPNRITPCARIDLFERVQSYSVNSIGKNVLLKYKGNGVVLPREGSSVDRVGLFGYFQGRRFSQGMLDYKTNVEGITIGFSIH